ncbi:MAG: hypothetical protein KA214_03945 [Neisseriaceae bacterium]|nr:hypothetical protein [Neisseriaceae bacterium]
MLGLLSLGVAACQPKADGGTEAVPTDSMGQACLGFEDQEACAQVVQSCLDGGGTFESIALVNTGAQPPMFNIVCRGTESATDPASAPDDPTERPLSTTTQP